jgi:hypothetical protein
MAQDEKRSFWYKLFGRNQPSGQEERVIEYIIHRLGEGAHLGDVVEEEYVRRNASPLEIEEICADPRLVEAARQHLRQDFGSGELDPGKHSR